MSIRTVCSALTLFTVMGLFSPIAAAATPTIESEETTVVEGEPPPELAPVSTRETRAPKHPDCGLRTPLWEHEVQAGEHLGLVAGIYGVRRLDLERLNADLPNLDLIHPGQKIRVCPEIAPRLHKTVEHRVVQGDTITSLARAYGMSVPDFLATQVQPIADPDAIRLGQVLRFTVDGGMVEDFLPPVPPKVASRKVGGSREPNRTRVNVQLHGNDDVLIKRPHLAFGTAKTVRLLHAVVERYKHEHRQGPKVLIGDISKKGGGALSSHLSHRTGLDVDVGYVLRGAASSRTRFAKATRDTLDLGRTWSLVKSFLDTQEVLYIFMDYGLQKALYEYAREHGTATTELDELFQYPHGRGQNHGIVRHWRNHSDHFHVRFRKA